MAVRTRTLIRFRSPFDMPPNTDMIRSWASLFGSIGPPTSGTHSGTSVVNEQRERVTELVAVELPLRLPDHHRLEPTVRVLQLGQQRERLRPALPRDRPAVTGIEVLGDDDPAVGCDEGLGAGQLPGPGRLGVLLVLSGDPALERELDHQAAVLSVSMLTRVAGTDRGSSSAGPRCARRSIRNSAAAAAGLSCGGCSGTTTRTGSGAPACCSSPGPAARRAPRRAADGPAGRVSLTHSDIGIWWRHGTGGDDLGRVQRDRRAAAAGDPGAAAGR